MQRGRPLIVWSLALGLAGLWLGLRWPGTARERQLLALAMAGPPQQALAASPAHAAGQASLLPAASPSTPPVLWRRLPARPLVPTVVPLPAPLHLARQAVPLPVAPAAPSPPLPAPPPQSAAALLPPLPPTGFRLAEAAYARLAAGQRRQAAALFDAALALEPANRQWQADRAALGRRWQVGGFALLRDGGLTGGGPSGGAGGLAASPVLGGGQLGGSIAVLADPFARRPLALVARANVAAGPGGVQWTSGQAAIGLRQALLPGVSVSAERLLALGAATRSDWTLRLAAGGSAWRISGYGEAGVLGNGQIYAGAQGQARLLRLGPATLAAGSWASVQTGAPDVWRVDVGPSITANLNGLRLQADWRQRVGGNAVPGSGPVLTVSAGF